MGEGTIDESSHDASSHGPAHLFAKTLVDPEQRLRLYETILSNTPDLIYVFDLNHRFTYANQALLTMWGRTWNEAIGKNCLELGYPPDHAAMHDREIEQVIATRRPIRGVVPFTGTHGSRLYDYIFVPVFADDGRVEAVAGTTRDVTEAKRVELELRDSDRRKDEFLALLAHELRNPLAPLRNGLELLRTTGDDPATIRRLQDMMDRQFSYLVRLIDDLLDAARIRQNKLTLQRSRVSLDHVVAAAVEAVQPLSAARGHQLSVSMPETPVFLDGDLMRLAQIFSNLLTNSAKYTEPGGKLWLTARLAGGEVEISVSDTGIGIDPRAFPLIFELFSQAEEAGKRHEQAQGLGIGLALAKTLAEMHGGSIHAESDGIGKGSRFTVKLPVLNGEAEETLPAAPVKQATASGKRRILVVDDNQDAAQSMAMLLEMMGHDLRIAFDGLAAIATAEQFQPHLILMDIGMPRLDGREATRRIRAQPWGTTMMIVALTGWGQENDRTASRQAGCDGHLVKPVRLQDLEKLLMELDAET
ncbi:MAG: ATP-binding protein [Pseudomonadota bacterium]